MLLFVVTTPSQAATNWMNQSTNYTDADSESVPTDEDDSTTEQTRKIYNQYYNQRQYGDMAAPHTIIILQWVLFLNYIWP